MLTNQHTQLREHNDSFCGRSADARAGMASFGCYVLRRLPVAVYVKWDDLDLDIIPPEPCREHEIIGACKTCSNCRFFTGIVAVKPLSATWFFVDPAARKQGKTAGRTDFGISVKRWQVPIAPATCKTLHTLQGSTADPGMLAHWQLPRGLSMSSQWLAVYVMLSRVRGFDRLLSHGLPSRLLLESGPPALLQDLMSELFGSKPEMTKSQAMAARAALKWAAVAAWNVK